MSRIELVKVRAVAPLDDYKLDVEFSDGSSGVASLEDFVGIGPMMAPLRDPAFFNQVFLEMGRAHMAERVRHRPDGSADADEGSRLTPTPIAAE